MKGLAAGAVLLVAASPVRADFFDDARKTFQTDIPRTFEKDIPHFFQKDVPRAFGADKPAAPRPARLSPGSSPGAVPRHSPGQ